VKLIAGILLLKSPRVVDFINTRLAGLMVPDPIAERIRAASDPAAEAVELAIEQAVELKDVADGIHIMSLGMDEAVVRIAEEAGLLSG